MHRVVSSAKWRCGVDSLKWSRIPEPCFDHALIAAISHAKGFDPGLALAETPGSDIGAELPRSNCYL
jgi:hypothetical protein